MLPGAGPTQYRHEVGQLLGDQVLQFGGGQRLLPTLHRVLVEVLDEGLDGPLHVAEFLSILKAGTSPMSGRLHTPTHTLPPQAPQGQQGRRQLEGTGAPTHSKAQHLEPLAPTGLCPKP